MPKMESSAARNVLLVILAMAVGLALGAVAKLSFGYGISGTNSNAATHDIESDAGSG